MNQALHTPARTLIVPLCHCLSHITLLLQWRAGSGERRVPGRTYTSSSAGRTQVERIQCIPYRGKFLLGQIFHFSPCQRTFRPCQRTFTVFFRSGAWAHHRSSLLSAATITMSTFSILGLCNENKNPTKFSWYTVYLYIHTRTHARTHNYDCCHFC